MMLRVKYIFTVGSEFRLKKNIKNATLIILLVTQLLFGVVAIEDLVVSIGVVDSTNRFEVPVIVSVVASI